MDILKPITKKINELQRGLIINGLILVLLAVLIAFVDEFLRISVALMVLVLAYSFFYLAYKLWRIKKFLN